METKKAASGLAVSAITGVPTKAFRRSGSFTSRCKTSLRAYSGVSNLAGECQYAIIRDPAGAVLGLTSVSS